MSLSLKTQSDVFVSNFRLYFNFSKIKLYNKMSFGSERSVVKGLVMGRTASVDLSFNLL